MINDGLFLSWATYASLLWANGRVQYGEDASNVYKNAIQKRKKKKKVSFITKAMWRYIIGQNIYQLVALVILNFDGKRLFKLVGSDANVEVLVECIILIGSFALQHYGTPTIGFLFTLVLAWLLCIIGDIEHISLEPSCLLGTISILHVSLFKGHSKQRWDVLGRNSFVHYRY